MSEFRKNSAFRWTKNRERAAIALAKGKTQKKAAEEAGVTDRTIRLWLENEEFAIEVDRLTHMVGVATRAERLRIAMRVVDGRMLNEYPMSKADLLDWLKFIQSETDGVNLDLASLFAASASMAGSRQKSVVE